MWCKPDVNINKLRKQRRKTRRIPLIEEIYRIKKILKIDGEAVNVSKTVARFYSRKGCNIKNMPNFLFSLPGERFVVSLKKEKL